MKVQVHKSDNCKSDELLTATKGFFQKAMSGKGSYDSKALKRLVSDYANAHKTLLPFIVLDDLDTDFLGKIAFSYHAPKSNQKKLLIESTLNSQCI